jgi:hypothetical protein
VSSVDLCSAPVDNRVPLDLARIATHARNAEFNPRVRFFSCLLLPLPLTRSLPARDALRDFTAISRGCYQAA